MTSVRFENLYAHRRSKVTAGEWALVHLRYHAPGGCYWHEYSACEGAALLHSPLQTAPLRASNDNQPPGVFAR